MAILSNLSKTGSTSAWMASDLEAIPSSPLPRSIEPPLELEPLEDTEPLPDSEINKRAFYSSMLEGDPENFQNNYTQTQGELKVSGEAPLYDKHIKTWEAEQTVKLEGDVNNIILDPTIPTEQKIKVLQGYKDGDFISKDLEDKYLQETAIKDDGETQADKDSKDIMLDTLHSTAQAHRDIAQLKEDALSINDGGVFDFLIGAGFDFLPGKYTIDNVAIRNALSETLGEGAGQQIKSGVKAAFLAGSTNKEIGQYFDSVLDPEQKMAMLRAIISAANNPLTPSTSYNVWSQLQDKINQGQMGSIETIVENVIGWVDLHGLSRAIRNPLKFLANLTSFKGGGKTYGLSKLPTKEEIIASEKAKADKASNPPTGTEAKPEPAPKDNPEPVVPSNLASIGVMPSVAPTSPLGMTQVASPTAARNMATQGILDENYARMTGNEPGEIVGSFGMEKIDEDFLKNHPDITKDLEQWDKKFNKLYDETAIDPYLVDTVERTKEKDRIYTSFVETQGAYYQASNSTISESLGSLEGRARFGRNADFPYNSMDEAINAEKNINSQFTNSETDKFETKIVQENGAFYVDLNWKKQYDPFSAREFGIDSTSSTFGPFNTSTFTRGHAAKFVYPPTTRLPEWFTKGGYLNSVTALKITEQFNKLQKEIINTKHINEFDTILLHISENQKYLKEGDVASLFPHLDQSARSELMKKQYLWARLSDYTHAITNRVEHSRLTGEGKQGIWKGDEHLGNGKATDQVPKSVEEVWDYSLDIGVKKPTDLKGKQFVKLDEPISRGNRKYNYAIVGGSTKLDMLPSVVVPKIEGYVPRMNIESWYVKAHPKSIYEDGVSITDTNTLRDKHTRTIGAAKDEAEAKLLVERMKSELGDDVEIFHARERSDIGDVILTDFKVYKEKTDYGKKRGDRLPTLNGFARLEHPMVAANKRIQTLARLDAWRGYDEVVKKNFMKRFSAFLPTGEFPNTLHDLKLPNNPTEDMVKSFGIAQRIFEQYTNSKYKLNQSDIVWKTVGHKIADNIEGWLNNIPAEKVREVANKGDLFRKGLKSLGTNLFLNLSPQAQWLVQTQVILPFALMEGGFRSSMHMLPALMVNVLSRASEGKPYAGIFKSVADKIAITNPKEFNEIADAIYSAGIPQGVDLNMMLHGGLDEISKPLVEGFGGKVVNAIDQVVTTPGKIGKTIGYAPAQLMADMAGFLFAKARWEKMNPGKNWNTPTHIRQIAGDAWDIMGSMSTRAGSMPYQDGYLGILFQFQAVLAKNLFTLFSSKTLKKAPGEIIDPRVKLAASNMAVFGIYGVPASSVIYELWEDWFGAETNPETLAIYEKYKGGLVDLVTNGTIDTFFAEPGDVPMDLAIAKRIGPMPDKLPYVDLGWEMWKFMTGNKTDNPRFPFVNAVGSMYDAVRDSYNILSIRQDYSTPEAMMLVGAELAEATSGFNNYAKAASIMELGDKKNKFGNHLGLELTFAHAVAQTFGVQSQREVNFYEMLNNQKERKEYIKQRVQKLQTDMEKMKDKIGTPDWTEYVRRTKVLNSFTREEDQEEIAMEFMKADRLNYLNNRESMMKYLVTHYKGQNDKFLVQMMAGFKNGTPQEQEFIKMLERNLEGNK